MIRYKKQKFTNTDEIYRYVSNIKRHTALALYVNMKSIFNQYDYEQKHSVRYFDTLEAYEFATEYVQLGICTVEYKVDW